MEALVAAAISIVAPYLAKGGEAFAQEVGTQAAGAVKAVVERLRRWWSREPVAEAAADHFPEDPEKYAPLLGGLLAAELGKDEAFAAELRGLVDDVGPHIDVVQRIEVGRGVTGAQIDELVRGVVTIEQDMKHATDVVGFKAGRVGGGSDAGSAGSDPTEQPN